MIPDARSEANDRVLLIFSNFVAIERTIVDKL